MILVLPCPTNIPSPSHLLDTAVHDTSFASRLSLPDPEKDLQDLTEGIAHFQEQARRDPSPETKKMVEDLAAEMALKKQQIEERLKSAKEKVQATQSGAEVTHTHILVEYWKEYRLSVVQERDEMV